MISIENWQPADGLILEPNALRAVREQEKCLALTAGPGAGKTEMLAQRADFLFQTATCRYPKRILAISFKVDASTNLKERVQRRCGYEMASRFDSYTFHALAKRIIDRFRVILTGENALEENYSIGEQRIAGKQITFNELVPFAIEILKNSAVARNTIRQTYSDVFLDEFQDCTHLQYELIKLAFQGTSTRLTAVGDTKQKIMAWAGALEGIFTRFSEDFNALSLNMYRNFRSKPRLLRLQNKIIETLDPNASMPEEQLQGDEGIILCYEYQNSREEAQHIVEQIESWINEENIPASEIAILVRNQTDLYANLIMEELTNRNIPYRNEQQIQDISTEAIARLIVDYLLCLYSKQESEAWTRLSSQLMPFFDDEELEFHNSFDFQEFLNEQRKLIQHKNKSGNRFSDWERHIDLFLNKIGIEKITALSYDYESQNRREDLIREIKSHIQNSLTSESDLVKVLRSFSDNQAVRILTIHKSKGLEFHSVIMLAIEEESFWAKEEKDKEENRCTFFVGVSRAKQRLIITYSHNRLKPNNYNKYWRVQRTKHNEYWRYFDEIQ